MLFISFLYTYSRRIEVGKYWNRARIWSCRRLARRVWAKRILFSLSTRGRPLLLFYFWRVFELSKLEPLNIGGEEKMSRRENNFERYS